MKRLLTLLLAAAACISTLAAQPATTWRAATPDELSAFLPARAQVAKERIESEMRTASGLINERGQLVASVLLITAGYAAEGKFSHYLLTQHAIRFGDKLQLAPGAYVIGWTRTDDGLIVHLYDAATIRERGTLLARPITPARRVESFHIWPPGEQSYIQIGRYMLPYSLNN